MYLSRVLLNPSRRGTGRFLASPQAMHAVVLASCGPEAGGADQSGRVLWRVDRPEKHRIELYVVSPEPPDFTGLIEQAGWPTRATWDTADYDPFLQRIEASQSWRFRLTANPVRSVSAGEGKRGKVTPHLTRRHQEEWFVSRCQQWGFEIPTRGDGADGEPVRALELSGIGLAEFGRSDPDSGRRGRVSVTRVTYRGELTVTDPDVLRRVLTSGIGRAKAYGCGLLTLAPT
ncbi:type I-E CRISPR-associated protein Cas6/Cse3/CasE [Barrientosiimonas humi]|uniref:type I-E CRISPR-associated protein Cas6/Cse3/CasE n=1 Tax=Barrientosiimonas humi TaxID=999931 RepID=UPI00370D9BB8